MGSLHSLFLAYEIEVQTRLLNVFDKHYEKLCLFATLTKMKGSSCWLKCVSTPACDSSHSFRRMTLVSVRVISTTHNENHLNDNNFKTHISGVQLHSWFANFKLT